MINALEFTEKIVGVPRYNTAMSKMLVAVLYLTLFLTWFAICVSQPLHRSDCKAIDCLGG